MSTHGRDATQMIPGAYTLNDGGKRLSDGDNEWATVKDV